METRVVKEEDVEKHISGCMAGFFNIFDRPNLLSPKRLSSLKTEPSLDSGNQSVYSTPELRSPAPAPRENLPEFKQQIISSRSPWRFSEEAPRLSLDSRAVVDGKGSLKEKPILTGGPRSPSVIARLMGLDALPASQQQPLQRSASESRVMSRFVDSFNFQNLQYMDGVEEDPSQIRSGPSRTPTPTPTPVPQRNPKCFFNTADFYPEPRQTMSRGSDSDLETLKQLLEALRLKGLLHSRAITNRNLVPIRSVTCRRDGKTGVKTPNRRPTLPQRSFRSEHVHTRNTGRRRPIEADVDEYNRHGKTLLERCDKLLHSIAEMETAGDSQPSPVSVLDASLYHHDSSPSPVMKRSLHFTDLEDESWGGFMSSSSDSEFVYISHILRAFDRLPKESDIFSYLEEKQLYLKGKCASPRERRLIFDAVHEIVGRIRRLPPWIIVGDADKMLQLTWSEFHKLRKKRSPREEADLVGYVCGVLGRDLSEDPWPDFQVEMSEAVLHIERLLFKDLIGETISHMAALNGSSSPLRRRLLF